MASSQDRVAFAIERSKSIEECVQLAALAAKWGDMDEARKLWAEANELRKKKRPETPTASISRMPSAIEVGETNDVNDDDDLTGNLPRKQGAKLMEQEDEDDEEEVAGKRKPAAKKSGDESSKGSVSSMKSLKSLPTQKNKRRMTSGSSSK